MATYEANVTINARVESWLDPSKDYADYDLLDTGEVRIDTTVRIGTHFGHGSEERIADMLIEDEYLSDLENYSFVAGWEIVDCYCGNEKIAELLGSELKTAAAEGVIESCEGVREIEADVWTEKIILPPLLHTKE